MYGPIGGHVLAQWWRCIGSLKDMFGSLVEMYWLIEGDVWFIGGDVSAH